MNLSTLPRSSSMLSRRVFTSRPFQSVRFRSSSTTYSIPLSSSSVLRLDIAVTSKEVTLKLVETETEGTRTLTTTGKTAGSDKESEASGTNVTPVPITSKSGEKGSPGSVKSTEVVECWVDASPTHISIVVDNRYKTFVLKDGWMTNTRKESWAPYWVETAAIELAVEYLAQHGYTGHAQIRSDSATARLAMSGGKVRIPEVMESAHRTDSVLKNSNLTMSTVKVSSKANIARRFSRGKIVNADGYKELGGGLTIPKALAPFIEAL